MHLIGNTLEIEEDISVSKLDKERYDAYATIQDKKHFYQFGLVLAYAAGKTYLSVNIVNPSPKKSWARIKSKSEYSAFITSRNIDLQIDLGLPLFSPDELSAVLKTATDDSRYAAQVIDDFYDNIEDIRAEMEDACEEQ